LFTYGPVPKGSLPRDPLSGWLLVPPSFGTLFLNTLGLTLKSERSQVVVEVAAIDTCPCVRVSLFDICLQVTNRVSSVQFVSATAGSNGGVDIVASVLDASGAPVPGRSLSCWVRSTCGLVEDMVPGWTDTSEWITMANSLNVGPGEPAQPTSTLSLPSYCSSAGYPSYVRLLSDCSVAAM